MLTWDEGGDFRVRVLADADIAAHLSREQIARAFALDTYLRNVDQVFARVFAAEDEANV
jgi:adenylosuccinate lyase